MPHSPQHTPLLRRLLLHVVAPAGSGAVLALALWANGLLVGLATTAALIVLGACYQLREQFVSANNPPGSLAPATHAWNLQLARLARRAGVPTPALYLDPCWGTIAGTVGYARGEVGIVVEGGVLRALSLTGSAGLLAHELGHITMNHVGRAVGERIVLQSAARLLQLLGFAALFASHLGLLWFLFSFCAIWLLPMRAAELLEASLLRRKELAADLFARDLVGEAVTSRGLREFEGYVEAQREWAQALYDAQNPSLWSRLARNLHRAPDAAVLLAAMERLEEAADRAVALVDAPPPSRAELISHSRRLRRLIGNLPLRRSRVPQLSRPTAALQAGWSALNSSHPSTEERLRHLRLG